MLEFPPCLDVAFMYFNYLFTVDVWLLFIAQCSHRRMFSPSLLFIDFH